MPIELVALIIFSVAQIGTPGPANMALLATGASFGFRRALPFVVGVVVVNLLDFKVDFEIPRRSPRRL